MRKFWFYLVASGIAVCFTPHAMAQSAVAKTPDPSANSVDLFLNHTVKKGETYYSLSKQYKTSVKELQELNPDYPVLKTGAIIKVKRPIMVSEEAKSGTTGSPNTTQATTAVGLSKVNSQDSIKRMKDAARVERTNLLLASDINKAAVVVTVQSGETLYSISKKYGIPVEKIKFLNDLENDNLQIGQVLVLPPEARKNTGNSSGETTNNTVSNNSTTSELSVSEVVRPAAMPPTQKESDKVVLAPNTAVAPNPVVLTQKDSVANAKNLQASTTAASNNSRVGESNKRDAGGMPELGAKKKVALKEYEKNVKVSVGQTGMDPDRHWVLVNNHKNGEVVALVNPDTKTIVWCVVMGPAKGKADSEIIISEALSRKLNVDLKKSKLIFRYAAP